MVCEQALKARLEIRFGVALCRAYLLAPSALVRSALPYGLTPEGDGIIGHRLASNFLALLVCWTLWS
jgi:hypothetical protein